LAYTPSMPLPDRDACERRVFRLASLIGGDPAAALRVVEAVIDVPGGVGALDDAHLDRLTILRSREMTPRAVPLAGLDPVLARRFAAMHFQHREAWILAEVYGLLPRDAAKAMDCSVTAMERHLAAARSGIEHVEGEGEALSEAMRARSLALTPPPSMRRRRRMIGRVRRWTRIVIRLLIAGAVIALIGFAAWAVIRQLPALTG